MMFSPGCGCCTTSACGQVCVTVTGCNGKPLPGATVATTLTQVSSVAIAKGGTGYNNGTFNGTANGNGGSGCTFQFTVSGGAIQNPITITNGGSGYTAPPNIFNFSAAGSGTGATATATIATATVGSDVSSGQVTAVNVAGTGAGYTNGSYTNGTFTGGGGSGATFSYTVSGGAVQNTIAITNPGSGYTSTPTAVFSAGTPTVPANTTTTWAAKACAAFPARSLAYKVTTSAPGFADNTQTTTPSSCTIVNLTAGLAAATGFVCGTCCDVPYALPATLYLTTPDGLVTLARTSSGGSFCFQGSINHTRPGYVDPGDGTCAPQTVTGPILYTVTCNSGATAWTCTQEWAVCASGSSPCSTGGFTAGGVAASGVAVPPLKMYNPQFSGNCTHATGLVNGVPSIHCGATLSGSIAFGDSANLDGNPVPGTFPISS